MDFATLVIIFFNVNQLKLNRKSLNIDINFKVFEFRKQVYQNIVNFIKHLKYTNSVYDFINVHTKDDICSEEFIAFKNSVQNSKYLFPKELITELDLLLYSCEKGISIERQAMDLKVKDPSTWTSEDQKAISKSSRTQYAK